MSMPGSSNLASRSYRQLREAIRQYYRDHYPLTEEARMSTALNPGAGWVSRLCHEPRVAVAVIEAMLMPYEAGGQLVVSKRTKPRFGRNGSRTSLRHHISQGGSESGDAYSLCGVRNRRATEPGLICCHLLGRSMLLDLSREQRPVNPAHRKSHNLITSKQFLFASPWTMLRRPHHR